MDKLGDDYAFICDHVHIFVQLVFMQHSYNGILIPDVVAVICMKEENHYQVRDQLLLGVFSLVGKLQFAALGNHSIMELIQGLYDERDYMAELLTEKCLCIVINMINTYKTHSLYI